MIDEEYLIPEEVDIRYINSPFKHLKNMLPKNKGSRFEKITSDVYTKLGYNVEKSNDTSYDRLINKRKCEIKGSTLAKNTDTFSFLQIRPDQNYDVMIFALFYPQELCLLEMDKKMICKHIDANVFKKQHGGNKANSRTYCYYGNKETLLSLGAKEIQ
jgi:hypothetical protein